MYNKTPEKSFGRRGNAWPPWCVDPCEMEPWAKHRSDEVDNLKTWKWRKKFENGLVPRFRNFLGGGLVYAVPPPPPKKVLKNFQSFGIYLARYTPTSFILLNKLIVRFALFRSFPDR